MSHPRAIKIALATAGVFVVALFGPAAGADAVDPTAATTGASVAPGGPDLRPCPRYGPRALCGTVRRPWDPTGDVPGKVGIGFVSGAGGDDSRAPLGTIVAHEGGPGYPATGTAGSYRALFRPLLERRNLLLVDQRGTGRSAPIDCPELQDLVGTYADAAEVCGARLGDHAHLYGTELAADDLAAVIDRSGSGRSISTATRTARSSPRSCSGGTRACSVR